MTRMLLFCLMFGLSLAHADVSGCSCAPNDPKTLKDRACSLTLESLKQPAGTEFFALKDSSPRKPNRWLVLPAGTGPDSLYIERMTPKQRTAFWKVAVAKARELFGDNWGIAYNGQKVRTQCQFHVHVGRFITASETRKFVLVKRLEDIPLVDGDGLWLHPAPGGFHVHQGEQTAETCLVR